MTAFFYLDRNVQAHHRYDLARFMRLEEGVHDEFTSWLISRLRGLPSAGRYRIEVEQRPDIYSRDVFGTTDYWQLLLLYNDVVLLEDLARGTVLSYFSLDGLEGVLRTLQTQPATA